VNKGDTTLYIKGRVPFNSAHQRISRHSPIPRAGTVTRIKTLTPKDFEVTDCDLKESVTAQFLFPAVMKKIQKKLNH
jgi:hypothetical protein